MKVFVVVLDQGLDDVSAEIVAVTESEETAEAEGAKAVLNLLNDEIEALGLLEVAERGGDGFAEDVVRLIYAEPGERYMAAVRLMPGLSTKEGKLWIEETHIVS